MGMTEERSRTQLAKPLRKAAGHLKADLIVVVRAPTDDRVFIFGRRRRGLPTLFSRCHRYEGTETPSSLVSDLVPYGGPTPVIRIGRRPGADPAAHDRSGGRCTAPQPRRCTERHAGGPRPVRQRHALVVAQAERGLDRDLRSGRGLRARRKDVLLLRSAAQLAEPAALQHLQHPHDRRGRRALPLRRHAHAGLARSRHRL